MWFNILKIQETITDLGIDFDLPEKVESKDKKDKCCEEAKAEYDRYRRYWVYGGSSAMDKEPEFLPFDNEEREIHEEILDLDCDSFYNELVDQYHQAKEWIENYFLSWRYNQETRDAKEKEFEDLIQILKNWEECEK